jgi:hypothetical protein
MTQSASLTMAARKFASQFSKSAFKGISTLLSGKHDRYAGSILDRHTTMDRIPFSLKLRTTPSPVVLAARTTAECLSFVASVRGKTGRMPSLRRDSATPGECEVMLETEWTAREKKYWASPYRRPDSDKFH